MIVRPDDDLRGCRGCRVNYNDYEFIAGPSLFPSASNKKPRLTILDKQWYISCFVVEFFHDTIHPFRLFILITGEIYHLHREYKGISNKKPDLLDFSINSGILPA
jgi:hypothetical protein